MSITITPADVGRKVRLRNGDVRSIKRWEEYTLQPVILFNGNSYTEYGFFNINDKTHSCDIIAFADEPEAKAPTDQHKQIWLQTYIALLPKYTTVDHAAAAANAAVEAFKKFERGE